MQWSNIFNYPPLISVPPHSLSPKTMVQHSGHALVPLLNKILVSSPLLQHTPFMLNPSGARKPLVLSIFGHPAHLGRPLTRPCHLHTPPIQSTPRPTPCPLSTSSKPPPSPGLHQKTTRS